MECFLCQMMETLFIEICLFVRCEMLVPNAKEVGTLVCW